ncbi:hypothetical protein R3P38DRAFT_2815778 [Favolaschia claudopus]|uniref:Uncharacterized protein n=1 Tax=Favolaschia claudopus TaxID=2862362 RepID=A0AAV9Z0F9_9AGAR
MSEYGCMTAERRGCNDLAVACTALSLAAEAAVLSLEAAKMLHERVEDDTVEGTGMVGAAMGTVAGATVVTVAGAADAAHSDAQAARRIVEAVHESCIECALCEAAHCSGRSGLGVMSICAIRYERADRSREKTHSRSDIPEVVASGCIITVVGIGGNGNGLQRGHAGVRGVRVVRVGSARSKTVVEDQLLKACEFLSSNINLTLSARDTNGFQWTGARNTGYSKINQQIPISSPHIKLRRPPPPYTQNYQNPSSSRHIEIRRRNSQGYLRSASLSSLSIHTLLNLVILALPTTPPSSTEPNQTLLSDLPIVSGLDWIRFSYGYPMRAFMPLRSELDPYLKTQTVGPKRLTLFIKALPPPLFSTYVTPLAYGIPVDEPDCLRRYLDVRCGSHFSGSPSSSAGIELIQPTNDIDAPPPPSEKTRQLELPLAPIYEDSTRRRLNFDAAQPNNLEHRPPPHDTTEQAQRHWLRQHPKPFEKSLSRDADIEGSNERGGFKPSDFMVIEKLQLDKVPAPQTVVRHMKCAVGSSWDRELHLRAPAEKKTERTKLQGDIAPPRRHLVKERLIWTGITLSFGPRE